MPANMLKVKSMQRSGTEAIRTQIQPSKPKWEITNITNNQNTKRTYGQPSEQLLSEQTNFVELNIFAAAHLEPELKV